MTKHHYTPGAGFWTGQVNELEVSLCPVKMIS